MQPRLPAPDTQPGIILTLIALSGEFPSAQIVRLSGGDAYKENVVKQLKREKLVRTFYRDGLRGLRLTAAAKKLLLERQPEQFQPYLTGCSDTNRLKSEAPRRRRLHRMAEVLVTMRNADVSVLPWEKPDVFTPMPPDDTLNIDRPAYYSSREVKELGEQAIKVRNSRSTGVLLTDSDIFIVYNTGPGQMKWEYKAEMRFKALLEMELCQSRLKSQFMHTTQAAIVFAADMNQMAPLMGVGGDKRHNYFVLDGGFEHFYCLPCDHHGEVTLQLLCCPEEKTVLDDILGEGYGPARTGWLTENDAMDGETPVLFGCTFDAPRIKRFCTGLEKLGLTGVLYCFDFQEDAMRQLCGSGVDIRCIDFDAYERSVFLSLENN